jgi:lipid-A-disaccharide synthase-like uncharacterized protein
MLPDAVAAWSTLPANAHLIAISVFGGYVLFGLKMAEHFMRSAPDKMPLARYVACFTALFVVLPVLGGSMTAIYLMNGDRLSPILALQVGLTSPAIVQSLIIAAAHSMSRSTAPRVHPGQ